MALLLLLTSWQQAHSQDSADYSGIVTALNYYLDGGTNNDFETLKLAFHEDAMMQFIDGEGAHQSVNALEFFGSRMKPGPKSERQTRITSIEYNGSAASRPHRDRLCDFPLH